MTESENNEEPKIIVDDDWKEQVAKEKAAADASEPAEVAAPPETETAAREPSAQVSEPATDEIPPPPPASFEVLISMLFTQAMATLGQFPDPNTGQPTINKPYAKHYIDTMEMLGVKTKGNLSDDEAKMLSEALHALRMAYVSVKAPPKAD
ncbi:hypothetical protein K227x_10020 [Rubripirellula lacrimiformis]|uniref:DUF1844 domain-containing protein n=1 Tax=Rubripirellula lacrimiformis TaxID=1930273 RepID=A0A517N661_9BACT|nr:DUF1844 domain-containing protein [Rubripirellula lacrimiformis]QDT02624.1 hypothetical protein K227x_10020 [Rubripirellula lacrimiformis]